jgi:hypothetical protein
MKNLWERDINMNRDECHSDECGNTKYRWLGPGFFTVVLLAVIVFFVWFLRA